jgi:hypothetical protein
MFRQKPPRLITIAILSTICIISWVFLGLYEVLSKKPDVSVPETLLEDINPQLDTVTLQTVQTRLFFEAEQVQSLPQSEESGE